jgi:hypothetical protein
VEVDFRFLSLVPCAVSPLHPLCACASVCLYVTVVCAVYLPLIVLSRAMYGCTPLPASRSWRVLFDAVQTCQLSPRLVSCATRR